MTLGRNTMSGELLESFVARVESVRAEKRQLSADEAQIMAEAKADGFVPGIIRVVVRRRSMKPHVLQETEALVDTYLHALGHISETPLFRQVGLIKRDIASREAVIEAMKAFVPENGSITIETGGKPVRLTRDKDGNVSETEVVDPPPRAGRAPAAAPASMRGNAGPPPDVDADAAEEMGRQAWRDDAPIITNPFPFGDGRRPRWDEGWRRESGSDGMGGGGEP